MKQYFLLSILLIALSVNAQEIKTSSTKLSASSIVRDSSGNQYAYAIWSALLNTGDYTLLSAKGKPDTDYILKRLSPEEKQRLIDMSPAPRESKYFKTGEKIKSFNDRDLNGNKYKLKDMQGKIVVLNFWFINCPPCRQEMPDLNELVKDFSSNKDVVFIAVALDNRSAIEEFLQKTPFNYNIIENGKYISELYGITSYPTHVVVDREGLVQFHTVGLSRKTVSAVRKAIEDIIAKPVATTK